MSTKKRFITLTVVLVVIVAVVLGITLSSSSPKKNANAGAGTGSGSGKPAGTVSFAEAPGAAPNYIFPYMGCSFFSVSNSEQFQDEMYRPLYWFGLASSSTYVPALSLGDKPKFSNGDKTITIDMKGWKFADGQTVDAQAVMFFLNMYKADPSSYCGYNGGFGIPDQVSSASGTANTVTIHFTTSVNPGWILYNYLSEITPLPNSWDMTSATAKGSCATDVFGSAKAKTDCKAVETYLDAQSAKTSTYTDALWQGGDDGPYKLTAFDSLGNATFVPNTKYSGPQKSQVAEVKLESFTSTQAEENQLQAGKLSLGFVDTTILTSPAKTPGAVGPNWPQIASTYNIVAGPGWNFNYAPFNFASADPKAAAIKQLYIRQALQTAVDQNGIISNVDKGYGFPIFSPLPPNTSTTISGQVPNPYPFNLKVAKKLLTSHGWKIVNKVQTCENPGTGAKQCGPGITKGYTLNMKIIWASGSPALDDTFNAEIADWGEIGIMFTHTTDTFNNVIADCDNGAGYEICSWGGGWTYAPDFYPSGETLFTPKGGFNPGEYKNSHMTTLINTTTFGRAKLTKYATYASQQLPVLYQPQGFAPGEVINTLKSSIGFTPNPLGNFMPEYYHF
jgi:peptide/nickel transport system substrate-binding protein